ncbi:hypothetical protein GCM10027447_04200 [Glycomyces halotolerans]
MGKFVRYLLITLVIVAAVLALGDRVANAVAERRIATEVAETAADHGAYSDQRPDVTVHGWPFVTQAWSGDFEQIDISLREVGANGLTFPTLDLVANDVEADWREFIDGEGRVTAATVDASGTIALEALSNLVDDFVDFEVSVESGGTVRIDAVAEAFGQEVAITGTGQIELVDGALRIDTERFEPAEGVLPEGGQELLDQYTQQFNTTFDLPELPYGIELTEIHFTENSMEVTGSARDVVLT